MAVGLTQPLTGVPGIFPGGKGGRCVGLTTLQSSCADCLKSGSLNLLEPSGPVQACNGTALHDVTRPFPLLLTTVVESTMYEQVLAVF